MDAALAPDGARADAASGDGGGHPLENWRWLRLVLITISAMICSGLGPGIAVVNVLLVDAGVGSSLCESGGSACHDQKYLFVSQSISSAVGASLLLALVAGWLFDRIGGQAIAQLGAAILGVGFLILQIPLYGAQHGLDAQTRSWLLVAAIFTETGASLTTMCVMSVAWHFWDVPTTMASFVLASDMTAALVPNVLSALMGAAGLSVSSAMLVWFLSVVLAGACCRYAVPTMEEFRAQAKRVVGTLPPTNKMPIWQMFWDANVVLLRHWWVHLILACAMSVMEATFTVYSGVLGDLGAMMFGSAAAGDKFTSMINVMSAVGGVLTAPLVSWASDSVSKGEFYLLASLIPLGVLQSICIAQATWLSQVLTCFGTTQLFAIIGAYLYRHCFAYAGPARIGMIFGLLEMYMSLAYLAFSSGLYAWMSSLPSSGIAHLTLPLQAGSVVQTCLVAALASCMFIMGLPQEPVTLATDAPLVLPTAGSNESPQTSPSRQSSMDGTPFSRQSSMDCTPTSVRAQVSLRAALAG